MTVTNVYYEFTPAFIAGDIVRSGAVNTQFAAIQSAFDLLPATSASVPTGKATFAGATTGSGNAYEVAMPNTRTSNAAGDEVVFIADRTNTGAATLNVDSIGAVSLRKADGSVLAANDILVDLLYVARYDSTNTRFQLVSPAASYTTDAAASAAAAAVSETNAATSETNAATSETNAATSETNAAASEAAAAASAAASGGLTPTYKTANYTAVSRDFVVINSGGTARTITLPATIAAGDRIGIHHFNTSATAVNVTVARNGHTIRYKGDTNGLVGGSADDVLLQDGDTIYLIATSSSNLEIV